MNTNVLIVGAGPTGLTLACALRRHGVECRIVDKAPRPATTSRAIGTQARTLEIFSMMGVLDTILARGHRGSGVQMYLKEQLLLDLPLDGIDERDGVPYPYFITMPQAETEAVLRERAEALGGEVEWGTQLVRFDDTKAGVVADIEGPSGTERVVARYLVSCEGAHSSVRHALGVSFEGEKYEAEFLLMDAEVEWDVPRAQTRIWFGEEGVCAAMPLPGTNLWRLFTDVLPGPDGTVPQATRALFERLITERRGRADFVLHEPVWASNFRIQKRMVDRYRVGRVFLAGDAAHVHSPFGGQGMNTGIGDAWNLAWKLAAVLSRKAGEELLDTYQEERLPIAAGVLRSTDRNTRVFYSQHPIARAFRRWVLLPALRIRAVRKQLVWATSQLGFHYRGASLSEGRLGGLRGGERVPDGVIDAAGARLLPALDGLRFTVIGIGLSPEERALFGRRRDVASLDVAHLAREDALVRIARLPKKGVLVVRPDGYLGIATAHPAEAAAWLDRVLPGSARRAPVSSAAEVPAA